MPEATAPAAPSAAPVAPEAPAVVEKPAAAVVPDGATPEKPAPEEKPKPSSAQFAAIAKKERELRALEDKLKAERAEVDTIRKQGAEYEAARKAAKLNPLAFMKSHGLTFAEVQDFVLRGEEPSPEVKQSEEFRTVREQVDALKKEMADRDAAEKEKAKAIADAGIQQAIQQWTGKLTETIKAGGEKYEFVAAAGTEAIDLMRETLEAAFDKDGTRLTIEQLLERAEAYYESKVAGLLQTKKARAKLAPEAPKPAVPKAASEFRATRAAPRTLTNSTAAPAAPTGKTRPLTREERIEAAAEGIAKLNRARRG
jgi:hypothetical protein